MKVFCGLTPAQARLYQKSAEELAHKIATKDGIERRGLVLAFPMRFKQICNHADQLTGKQDTGDAVLTGGAEKALTEMSDAELLDFIRLDLPVAARL